MSAGDGALKKNQRPDSVSVGVEIMHVWAVDMKLCLFSVEMCVYTRWRCPDDESDVALADGGDGLDESWKPEWYPRVKVWNMAAELTERQQRFLALQDDKARETLSHMSKVFITSESTICCQITEEYDLKAFPFELQDLNIKIEVENAPKIEPIEQLPRLRVKTPVMTQIEGVMCLPDFNMDKDLGGSYRYKEGSNIMQIALVYEREFTYYLWNSYILVFGLTTMLLTVYSQPPDARMEIDITLLLVAVTFKVLMSEQLPPVSYLTFLDWYNLVGVLFILIGCIFHGVTSFFSFHGFSDDDIASVDRLSMWTFSVCWTLWNLLYMLAVRAQLEVNDAMTELDLLRGNGYELMQYGETKEKDGLALTFEEAMAQERDEVRDSVYGKYAGQSRVRPGQVLRIIFNLMRGIKHKEATATTYTGEYTSLNA